MIKAFLFDYGGVITSGGGGTELSDRLGAALAISPDEASELLMPVWDDYSRGKISENQLWESIEAGYGAAIPISKRAIWNSWDKHMQPRPEMVDLVTDLQAEGYPVGLMSNVIPNTEADIRENGGYDIFDFLILSCDVGFSKPQTEIYELALGNLPGIKPAEVVFVDDQARFLIPARDLGMETILAESSEQIALDIRSLLHLSHGNV